MTTPHSPPIEPRRVHRIAAGIFLLMLALLYVAAAAATFAQNFVPRTSAAGFVRALFSPDVGPVWFFVGISLLFVVAGISMIRQWRPWRLLGATLACLMILFAMAYAIATSSFLTPFILVIIAVFVLTATRKGPGAASSVDQMEARFRAIYPLRMLLTYQAQTIVPFWVVAAPFARIFVHGGIWLPLVFASTGSFLLAVLVMQFAWLLSAIAVRNYMKIAAIVLLLLAAVNGGEFVWAISLVDIPIAVSEAFTNAQHPLFALGPTTLYAMMILSMVYLAIVCVRAALALLEINPAQRRILLEGHGSLSRLAVFLVRILGFPGSIGYLRKQPIRFVLIVCLCFLFSAAMTGFILFMVVALPSTGLDGLMLVAQTCEIRECIFDAVEFANFMVPTVAAVIWALLLIGIATGTQKLIRRLLRVSLERVQQIDQRAPIVFLRAFRDDQVPLRRPRLGLLGRVMDAGRRRTSLDELLLEEATLYGPVIAIGNPHDKSPPYGAARGYFDNDSWQEAVADIVRKATGIVICIDDTEGIWWEIGHILSGRYLGKTLFLIHPKFAGAPANAALFALLANRFSHDREIAELIGPIAAGSDHRRVLGSIIGFFADKEVGFRTLESATASRFTYLLAIRTFLRRELPQVH
jgi:hypothetical protein